MQIPGSRENLFLNQFLKINFFLTSNIENTSMLSMSVVNLNSCTPSCVNGVCSNDVCVCRYNWSGEDCSIALKPDSSRHGLWFMIALLVLAVTLGVVLIYFSFYFCVKLFTREENTGERDFVLAEEWKKDNA